MRVKMLRCRICLAWYSPQAHNDHCCYCGAYPVIGTHYSYSETLSRIVELVSGCHVPLVLRNLYTR